MAGFDAQDLLTVHDRCRGGCGRFCRLPAGAVCSQHHRSPGRMSKENEDIHSNSSKAQPEGGELLHVAAMQTDFVH